MIGIFLCRQVVPFLEGCLLEAPLWMINTTHILWFLVYTILMLQSAKVVHLQLYCDGWLKCMNNPYC